MSVNMGRSGEPMVTSNVCVEISPLNFIYIVHFIDNFLMMPTMIVVCIFGT